MEDQENLPLGTISSTLSVPSKEIKGPKVGSPEQALADYLNAQ